MSPLSLPTTLFLVAIHPTYPNPPRCLAFYPSKLQSPLYNLGTKYNYVNDLFLSILCGKPNFQAWEKHCLLSHLRHVKSPLPCVSSSPILLAKNKEQLLGRNLTIRKTIHRKWLNGFQMNERKVRNNEDGARGERYWTSIWSRCKM